MNADRSLRLEGLVADAGTFRLGPVSIVAPPGRTLAVVGPNGAGKSTLLRVMAGIYRPRAGRIHRPGPAAWLPPPGAVQTGLPVRTVVALGRAARHPWAPALAPADHDAALEALDGFGLGLLGERPFDTLSSGQQQLVLVARLTVQDAAVCLVDEPTALLDPAHSAQVGAALTALAAPSVLWPEGRIVVIATHDLGLAARADRLLLLGETAIEVDPGEGFARERLAQVFGLPLSACPCCGRDALSSAPGTEPDDTIGSRV